MDELPKTTLTQRRSQISTGAKKLNKEMLNHSDTPTTSGMMPPNNMNPLDTGLSTDRGSVVRIAAWVLVVVLIGVGSAILVTNLLKDDEDPNAAVPDSNPVSSAIVDDTDDDEAVVEDDTDDEDITEEEDDEPVVETPVISNGEIAEYANTNRSRTSASPDEDNILLNRFKFYAEGGIFNYIFYDVTTTAGAIDPSATLAYDENNDLTLTLNNLYRDNVTGQNNTTSRDIQGLSGLTGTETANTGDKSTYKFILDKKFHSKLIVDTDNREIKVQIDLNKSS